MWTIHFQEYCLLYVNYTYTFENTSSSRDKCTGHSIFEWRLCIEQVKGTRGDSNRVNGFSLMFMEADQADWVWDWTLIWSDLQVHIGYLPNKKVVGLSKLARWISIYILHIYILHLSTIHYIYSYICICTSFSSSALHCHWHIIVLTKESDHCWYITNLRYLHVCKRGTALTLLVLRCTVLPLRSLQPLCTMLQTWAVISLLIGAP